MKKVLIMICCTLILCACSDSKDYKFKVTYMKTDDHGVPFLVDNTDDLRADNDSLAYRAGLDQFLQIKKNNKDPKRVPMKFEVYNNDGKFVFSSKY